MSAEIDIAALARGVLDEHQRIDDYGGRSWFECSCDLHTLIGAIEYATKDEHTAHVAASLAAALAEAGIGSLAQARADADIERARHYAREQQLLDDNGDAYWRGHEDGAQAVVAAVTAKCMLPEHRNWKSKQLLDAARAAAQQAATEAGASDA